MADQWTRRKAMAAGAVGAGALALPNIAEAEAPPTRGPPGTVPHDYREAPGPLNNPLKGWAAYAEDWARHYLPVAMAYLYVSWRELEPEPGRFAFDAWERKAWDHPLARGKHVVFRVWLDYPGLPTGVPEWLIRQGVAMRPYRDAGGEQRGDASAGLSPDYGDPRLVAGLERLIAALGARYGCNPRVAYVAIGLLGHWGEWHTYPRDDLAAPPDTQRRVLAAYRAAFPEKQLLARYPRDEAAAADWLGYHDDAFPDATGGAPEWHFLNALRAAGREDTWRRHPIGGEMVPDAAERLLGPDYGLTLSALLRSHTTWLGPYNPALEGGLDAARRQRAETLVRRMGYEYRLQRAWLPAQVTRGGRLAVAVELVNQGLAPFYYPWPVALSLLSGSRLAAQFPVDADLRQWMPGPVRFSGGGPVRVPRGRYAVGLGIVDPWRGAPAIKFANALPRIDGWTVLGAVEIT